jgi:hypothetical protein
MPGSDALEGQPVDARHYDRVVREDAAVLKPDGSLLALYVRKAIPRPLCRVAFDVFESAPMQSHNRGIASGGQPAPSGIAGFFDAEPRMPVCRLTAFNSDHRREFQRARPFVEHVSTLFRDLAPDRWAAQRDFLADVSLDFQIRNTVFTTITVNRSFRTMAHRDDGDLRAGLGVIAAMQRGAYDGGELIFPKYRTAIDLRTGGLCLADVHELHGNGPLVSRSEPFVRLSFVFYAREGMKRCGNAADEYEKALAFEEGS